MLSKNNLSTKDMKGREETPVFTSCVFASFVDEKN